MTRLRYYAPYWISAIVVIALVLLLLRGCNRVTPFGELPELAAELESRYLFICEDGSLWEMTGEEPPARNDIILAPRGGKAHLVSDPEFKSLSDMRLHEYAALISHEPIYIRQDGRVYYRANYSPIGKKCYASPISYQLSELPESAAPAEWAIKQKGNSAIELTVPAENMETRAKLRLSVKLRDGWYVIAEDSYERARVSDHSQAHYIFHITFPALHEGDYRVEVCIGDEWLYQEVRLTRKNSDLYTLS